MKKLLNIMIILLFMLISSCVPEDETETDGDITDDGDPNEVGNGQVFLDRKFKTIGVIC